MTALKSSKGIAVVATAVVMAMLFWVLNTKRASHLLEQDANDARLKSEALLSEKLLLEKDIDRMKDQIQQLSGKNVDLNTILNETSQKLQQQEVEYARMKKENASLAQIRKQRAELASLKNELENELAGLKELNTYLQNRNNELTGTVASLEERNRLLTDDLHKTMMASLDQSQIVAVKRKNEKVTASARRTKKLIANFEAPSDLKHLSFRIIDTNGNVLTPNDGTIAHQASPSESTYTASLDNETPAIKNQRIEMIYTPEKKLKSGVYTVEILNESLYVGSLKVKLN